MSINSSFKKIGGWVMGVIVCILIILALLYLFLGQIVKDRLISQVADQTYGAYTLTIDDLDIDILSGNATARIIHLIPDTLNIRRSKYFNDFYEITAPEISIAGLDLWQLFSGNSIEVDRLEIIRPQVKWNRNFKEIVDERQQKEVQNKNDTPPVKIGKILLKESGLEISENNNTNAVVSLDKASLRIDNFLMVGDTSELLNRMINFDDLTLSVKDYTMKLPDSLNTFHFDSLKASVKNSTLMINGIQRQPRYDKYEYSRKKGEETDRIELYNKEVYIKGLDFKKFKQENKFIAHLIVIDSINAVLYRDKTHPVKPTQKKKLVQQMIREAPVYLKIDSLQVNNTQITYQEKVEKEIKPGNIHFVNLQASVSNITNDSTLLEEGAVMKAEAQTYVMGVGKIQANFEFLINSMQNFHSIKGTASAMQLDVINPMLKYVAFAEIQSGQVNSLSFEARLNEDSSTGNMKFFYDDLKINLQKKGNNEVKNNLVSFFANAFVIKEANPLNNKFRPGEMYFERDKNKSMINFWWKTLLSGFKDSMGLPSGKADASSEK